MAVGEEVQRCCASCLPRRTKKKRKRTRRGSFHHWRAGRYLEVRGGESEAGVGVRSGRYHRDDLPGTRFHQVDEELRGENQGVGEQICLLYHLCKREDEKEKV